MSYRELRNLCEMTRTLRYPRLMSIENFRTPNFRLLAELLEWIVKKFEPEAALDASQIDTKAERVAFIKNAVTLMLQNSRIKMNPKLLYQADGHAVQEILPALQILYDAKLENPDSDEAPKWTQVKNKVSSKMQEVRITRQLSSQLPATGAALSEIISKPEFQSQNHERAASRPIPLAEAERTLALTIQSIAEEAEQLTTKLNNVASDEAELDEKIERKKREYEQMQKRYAKLQSFRPQYMDEYERYEKQLKKLYEVYVLSFRNLAYLAKVHDDLARSERHRQEELEKAMRLAVEKMRLEQEKNNEFGMIEDVLDAPLVDRRQSVRKVYGNMMGGDDGSDDDDDDDDDDDIIRMEDVTFTKRNVERLEEDDLKSEKDDFMAGINAGNASEDDKSDLSSGDDF